MTRSRKPDFAVLLVIYLVVLAGLVLWPTAEVPSTAVDRIQDGLEARGAPDWVSTPVVEFTSNVVLFIPLTFLGSLLWDRWHWLAWTLAGFLATVALETTQMLVLSARSPTVSDVVANTIGALAGALLALPVRARLDDD